MELVDKMLEGGQQSLSRLISMVERGTPEVPEIMKQVYPCLGKAYSVGVTGPPGGGKSTVVDRLTAIARSKGLTVGIIAVDPTSPFTGGAVLGDRIRMQQHYLDDGVFIRSMATRGSRGGLPRTARSVIKLLDAFGKNLVLVETVGVGQTELDIMEAVDTTIVTLVPEAGDTIQTMKAGLMEIADIFAVNKADRPGADQLVIELESALMLNPRRTEWEVPVLATQAVNNIGIEELYEHMERHRHFLESSGRLAQRRQEQRKQELLETMEERIRVSILTLMKRDEQLAAAWRKVENAELDPYSVADEVMGNKELLHNWLAQLESEGLIA